MRSVQIWNLVTGTLLVAKHFTTVAAEQYHISMHMMYRNRMNSFLRAALVKLHTLNNTDSRL